MKLGFAKWFTKYMIENTKYTMRYTTKYTKNTKDVAL